MSIQPTRSTFSRESEDSPEGDESVFLSTWYFPRAVSYCQLATWCQEMPSFAPWEGAKTGFVCPMSVLKDPLWE